MADQPFEREIINPRERPLSTDIMQLVSNVMETIAEMELRKYAGRESMGSDVAAIPVPVGAAGFIGAAFKPRGAATPAMSVVLDPGLGYINTGVPLSNIGGIVNVNDKASLSPLTLTAAQTIAVPAADGSNPRIDIIEVALSYRFIDPSSRDVLSGGGVFVPGAVNKTMTPNLNGQTSVVGPTAPSTAPIGYKTGTPNSSPTAPTVTAGYVKIAEVLVGAGATTLTSSNIRDLRRMLFPGGMAQVAVECRTLAADSSNVLESLVAPPGIEVTVMADPTIGFDIKTMYVYIKMGDASLLDLDITNSYRGTVVASSHMHASAAVAGETVVVQPVMILANSGSFPSVSNDTTLLASANPPMLCAPGQPLLVITLQWQEQSNPSGGLTFSLCEFLMNFAARYIGS